MLRLIILRLGLYSIIIIWLSACQHHKVDDTVQQTEWKSDIGYFNARQSTLKDNLLYWRYSAKVGVTTDSVREQANMVWQHQYLANNIRLYGPLGAGQVQLEFDQQNAKLSDNKGIVHQGSDAEALLQDIIGWPVPISALSYWLFVLPEPNAVFEYALDDMGNVSQIRQLGWNISFFDYRDYQGITLPRKITATRNGFANSSQVRVKLITKQWMWSQ